MQRFVACVDSFNRGLLNLAALFCFVLVLLTAGQVVARYLFDVSSIAIQELQWHLFGFAFLFAAAGTLSANEHVRVDIVYGKLGERHRCLIDFVGSSLFLLPMAGIMLWEGIAYVEQARSYTTTEVSGIFSWLLAGERSPDPGGLPARWLIKAGVPIAGLSLALQGIVLMQASAKRWWELR